MAYTKTTALKKIAALKKRTHVIQGGSSAGKTIAILIVLISKAQRNPALLISVVSETMPHLRKGAMRDFKNIMMTQKYWRDDRWNETHSTYTFETGSQLEFFSADSSDKVRGPRRNVLFVNEANNLSFETYTQLAIRTSDEIFIDFNPVAEFWAHTQIAKADSDFLVVTYKDNEGLPKEIVKEIESRRGNAAFWRVYGEGMIGLTQGVIYPNWKRLNALPIEARLVRRWLDYGYTNDPAAIGEIYKWNDSFVLRELAYGKGMSNQDIIDVLKNEDEQVPVSADSAEPKSNAELSAAGITVLPAKKGKDSILNGIQVVQRQKIFVVDDAVNIWKEQHNYIWTKDKKDDGTTLNVPIDAFNHHMDGIRYAITSLMGDVPDHVIVRQNAYFDRARERNILDSMK